MLQIVPLRCSRSGRVTLALMLAVLAAFGFVFGSDLEVRAKKIEGKLMAPCCGANTLAQHHSGPANEAKREIRRLLADGKSEKDILAVFVERHGPQILASPPASGFNLVAYLVPLVLLLVSVPLVYALLRRWGAAQATETAQAPPPKISPEDAERLRRALRDA